MKKLYLIRHGKSSWEDESLEDEERPLRRRGEKNAKLMAKLLRKQGIIPQQVLSSPAKRAISTARIFASRLNFSEANIEGNRLLYFEGINNIFKVIHQLNDKHETVFIFGHNPDFTQMANRFSAKPIDNVPTCGVVGIEFNADTWKDASISNGKMIFFDYPSNHR